MISQRYSPTKKETLVFDKNSSSRNFVNVFYLLENGEKRN